MSRLDSFIRRLEAQRACLGEAAALTRSLPGPVLELGLGAGRTYDHLRELLPEREIFVFERDVAVHPRHAPDPARLILGDFCETLAAARERFEARVALAHADIGTWNEAQSTALAARIAPLLAPLMRDGGLVVSDQPMGSRWAPLSPPEEVSPGRYYMYKVLR
ncbi:MAG: hypothetical protein GWN84_24065 [Gammaproteobacteria bacterium]|nr:hypothetical protein [Gammaproteobacteria bacterium]NIR85659.1 hypothetical protein [Gammaproteobacteria bacterium]NIR90147.1 hypothetical protein [Gammaproteobacteria bacterium]NIU06793.1 hypothetical protein [Gammaproteobacteria bacterium]NIV53726.1 hypothetical protein [Gammaproteobacteria bacterium]